MSDLGKSWQKKESNFLKAAPEAKFRADFQFYAFGSLSQGCFNGILVLENDFLKMLPHSIECDDIFPCANVWSSFNYQGQTIENSGWPTHLLAAGLYWIFLGWSNLVWNGRVMFRLSLYQNTKKFQDKLDKSINQSEFILRHQCHQLWMCYFFQINSLRL